MDEQDSGAGYVLPPETVPGVSSETPSEPVDMPTFPVADPEVTG